VLSRYERRDAEHRAEDPKDLRHFEGAVHSQNGEDGIITEIFRRVGQGHQVAVEIGASDGAENCTAALVDRGWSGIWIEGDHEKVAAARNRTAGRPVRVVEAYVDRESIVSVLESSSTPATPDLLVIDVDGNDYWIWDVIMTRYRPRVVVIEYNAVAGPRLQWVMPYDPKHRWNETAWHSAGLAALARLGRDVGYVLVGCDSQGVNAFFVLRSDAHHFSTASVREQWVPPRYSLPYGHPFRRFEQLEVPPLPQEVASGISLRVSHPRPTAIDRGQILYLDVMVTNETDQAIAGSGRYPVQVAYWWLDDGGNRVDEEPDRCHQLWRSLPHTSCNLLCRIRAPALAGTHSLVLGLVQEGVHWFDECNVTVGNWTVRQP
jgi:hypothetical protein